MTRKRSKTRPRAVRPQAEIATRTSSKETRGEIDVRLLVFDGPEAGAKLLIRRPQIVVGSGDVDLRLRHAAERHFIIEVSGIEVRLRDLGAPGGTLVNGRPVNETSLHDRDEIRVGETGMVIMASLVGPEPTGAAKSPKPPGTDPAPAAVTAEDTVPDATPARRGPSSIRAVRTARLEVVEGPDAGATFELTRPDVYLIGRRRGEIPLADPRCSAKHAQVELLGHGECFLQDLASTNGTFLNEQRIARTKLVDGDEVRVGGTRLRFCLRTAPD